MGRTLMGDILAQLAQKLQATDPAKAAELQAAADSGKYQEKSFGAKVLGAAAIPFAAGAFRPGAAGAAPGPPSTDTSPATGADGTWTDEYGNVHSADESPTDVSGMVGSAPPGSPGGGGILDTVLKFIGKNPLQAAQLGLAGVNTVQAGKLRGQQFGLINNALGRVDTAANAPPPNLGLSPLNPYRKLPPVAGMVGP